MSNHTTLVRQLITISQKLVTPVSGAISSQEKVHLAQQIINKLFEIGKRRVNISDTDKKEIGRLIPQTCSAIGLCINHTNCGLVDDPLQSACKQRSAIQFLLDIFGDIPSGEQKTVRIKLEELDIGGIIRVLDSIIQKWTDNPDIPLLDPEDYSEDKIDIEGVPDSHTWWF